nr:hypothetical protein [Tanacetum cinerariifolium]
DRIVESHELEAYPSLLSQYKGIRIVESHELEAYPSLLSQYKGIRASTILGITEGAARRWLEKQPPRSITTWDDLNFDESFHEAWERYKDLLRACPYHGFTELHKLDTFYNALNPADQDSLNAAAGVNQQTSAVTTAMTAMLKPFQSNPPPAQVKAVEEICVTCGVAHLYYQCLAADGNTVPEYRDNIQGYVSAATCNYNQGNLGYHPQGVANQMRPPEKIPQDALTIIENKSKVRNSRSKPIASPVNACDNHSSSELAKLTHAVNQQTSAVTTAMTAMLKQFQSNPPPAQVKAVEEICVTYRGAYPYYQCLAAGGNTFLQYQDNIQGYVSAATRNFNQVDLLLKDLPFSVNLDEDECVEETYTDPDHAEYNIKVPPP